MAVRIYKPTRSATQSGWGRTKAWLLEFPSDDRQIEPLMGWTSSSDTRPQIQLRFATKEEAVAYAVREGLDYTVEDEKPAKRRLMAYADNFKPTRQGQWTH